MSLETKVSDFFKAQGRTWSIDNEDTEITPELAREVLDRAALALYASKEATQLEVGGLIVRKSDGHTDVYVHIGEYNGNETS